MITEIGELIKKQHPNPLYNKMIDDVINKLNIVEVIDDDDIGYKQIIYEYYRSDNDEDK